MKKFDGRWFLGGSHLTLLLVCIFFYNLQRSPLQIVSAYITGFLIELAFYSLTDKNKERSLFDCLFSSATEAAGLLILVKSTYDWFYIPMTAVAVGSKYFLKKDTKSHLYNPTNFAIVAMFALVPRRFFELRGDEFNISFYPMLHVLVFGVFAVFYGKTWRVTVSYLVTICLLSFLLSVTLGESFIYLLGPEISAIGLIFMFLMITDPKTTPKENVHQYAFGSAVAILLYLLRMNEFYYAHYIALFLVILIRGHYQLLKDLVMKRSIVSG